MDSARGSAYRDGAVNGVLTAGPDAAPPLVLLHGWGASKEIWRLAFRAPLAERWRLIAPDLPGTGSRALPGGASMPEMAAWLLSFADEIGLERFAVLGHSMGGNVAAQFAAAHGDRVESLVLVSAALASDRLDQSRVYLHPTIGPPVLGAARRVAGAAGWFESRLPPSDEPGWLRGYMRRSGYLHSCNTVPALRQTLAGLVASPASLAGLPPDLPVLLIHGALDATVPISGVLDAAAQRPANTSVIVYDDGRHCPMDTHTARFVADVNAFLSRSRQRTAG